MVAAMRTVVAAVFAAASVASGNPLPWRAGSAVVIPTDGIPAQQPAWSPDGSLIAFAGPKCEGVAVVPAAGGTVRWLTREPLAGHRFRFSPDGRFIACRVRASAPPRHHLVRVIETATGEVASTSSPIPDAAPPLWQLTAEGMRWTTSGSDGTPVTGRWLPCTAPPPASPAPLLTARRGVIRSDAFTCAGSDPVISPDQSRVLFETAEAIAVRPLATDGTVQFIAAGQQPAWSPDGRWILYQMARDHTHAPDDPLAHGTTTPPHLHDERTKHRIVESDLLVVPADGGTPQPLTVTPDVIEVEPAWHPDGSAVVCRTEDTGTLLVIPLLPP